MGTYAAVSLHRSKLIIRRVTQIDAHPLQPSRLVEFVCVCVLEIQGRLWETQPPFLGECLQIPPCFKNRGKRSGFHGNSWLHLGSSLGFVTIHLFVIKTRDGKGHFTLELEGAWPMIYEFSHWLKKARESPCSFHTGAWGSEGPREFDWTKILHVVLHGNKCVMFRGDLNNVWGPPLWGGYDTHGRGPWLKI